LRRRRARACDGGAPARRALPRSGWLRAGAPRSRAWHLLWRAADARLFVCASPAVARAHQVRDLRKSLAKVANGEAFLLQARARAHHRARHAAWSERERPPR
jgi:3-deoxy-D-arabino-heptulosonate 7-phosphate (DAHP) synthase class II